MDSLTDLIAQATAFIGFVSSTLVTLTKLWFVFIPMIIMISNKGIGSAKGLLFYRKRRR